MTNPNDSKPREPGQEGHGDPETGQREWASNTNQAPRRQNPAERSTSQGFEGGKGERMPNATDAAAAADEESDSPQMPEGSEGRSAAAVRGPGRDPQYGTHSPRSGSRDAPKTVQGSTDEAPDVRGKQYTDQERDTALDRK